MLRSTQELARSAGVTSRTLRHHDVHAPGTAEPVRDAVRVSAQRHLG